MAAYEFTGGKWGSGAVGSPGGQVTWSFASTAIAAHFAFDAQITGAYASLVQAAFDRWESVANIDFVLIADSASNDIRLGWDAYDGPNGTVGLAWYEATHFSGGQLLRAEIFFDTAEAWSTDPNSSSTGATTNFFAVALHEIGHAIGLDHSTTPMAIMFASAGTQTNLHSDDIAGIQLLYGAAATPSGTAGPDNFMGTAGSDTYSGLAGNDTIGGLDGNDTLTGGADNDLVYGDGGNDQLFAGAGDVGNDSVFGGTGSDIIGGAGGADLLVGGTGSDTLFGGDGNDTLHAGNNGGPTSDGPGTSNTAWAGTGNDTVFGDNTADILGGGLGNDAVASGGGNDIIYGGAGSAAINGDLLYGGVGNDTIYGGTGADTIFGEGDADLLFGGGESDQINGGAGSDEIWGGTGDDTLSGGEADGAVDIFGFIAGSGSDSVTGFEVGIDVLDLSGTTTDFVATQDVINNASNSAGGLLINLGGGAILVLANLTTGDITAMDFIF